MKFNPGSIRIKVTGLNFYSVNVTNPGSTRVNVTHLPDKLFLLVV